MTSNERGPGTVKIVPFLPNARKIKPDGADIVEVLQCYTPEEITEHILNSEKNETDTSGTAGKIDSDRKTKEEPAKTGRKPDSNRDDSSFNFPANAPDNTGNTFQILGIAADDHAYFLDTHNRMIHYGLDALSDKKLVNLAGLQHWKNQCGGHPDTKQWLELIDELMHQCKNVDFEVDRLRGRGAWRTKKGEISYFDGRNVIGTPDADWIFVRRPQNKIGIGKPETSFEIRSEIFNVCKKFTFATENDIVKCLGWAAISAFGGALKWRPCGLLTGKSGTGKSALMEHIVNPMAVPQFFDGNETTEPGMRETIGLDSHCVTIDEFEPHKEKEFNRILSTIRTATTDNSPKTAKGTGGKGAITYRMRSMFMMAAINAGIDNIADDNRIIRINLTPKNNADDYADGVKRLKTLLNYDNSQGIRSFVWNNLEKIIKTGCKLEYLIQKQAGLSARFAAGESILLASFMHTFEKWSDGALENTGFLEEYVSRFYENNQTESERDETVEIIDRLLDELVKVDEENLKYSFRELLIYIKKFQDGVNVDDMRCGWYKRAAEQHGLSVHKPTGGLFIANNHNAIMKIAGTQRGYHRQLLRHEKIIVYKGEKNPCYQIDSAVKRGVVIGGVLEY